MVRGLKGVGEEFEGRIVRERDNNRKGDRLEFYIVREY